MAKFFLVLFLFPFFLPATVQAIESRTHNDQTYDVAVIDINKNDLKLYWKSPQGTAYGELDSLVTDLKKRGGKILVATNSGIYDKEYRPLGLHVERGVQIHKLNKSKIAGGNFAMFPNGVFYIARENGSLQAHVVETSEYVNTQYVVEATQSGPLLLRNGKIHPKFTKGSENQKLRSGVGVDDQGQVVFVISRGFVSFYDFADFFKSVLKCNDALYLDGSISAMTDEHSTNGANQLAPFVGIWAATNLPPSKPRSVSRQKAPRP